MWVFWPFFKLSIVFLRFVSCCNVNQYFISFDYWVLIHFVDLFIHQLMDIYVVYTFWLLWVALMVLWIFVYKFLCGCMFSFLLGVYLGVEVLDHVITLCLIFWGTAKLLSQSVYTILRFHQQCMRVPISLLPCQHLLLSVFFIIAILVGPA